MRFTPFLPSLILLGAGLASAQQKHATEAQNDGFNGPVQSVVTEEHRTGAKFQQLAGPTIAWPNFCVVCAYDADGYRVKSGSPAGDEFAGEIVQIERDGSGRILSRRAVDSRTGAITREEIWGPNGRTEETSYLNGSLFGRQEFWYDANGHMTDAVAYDPDGTVKDHYHQSLTEDGIVTEMWNQRPEGQMEWHQTYDPATDATRFVSYDESGAVKLTWSMQHGTASGFWAATADPNQFGESFSEFPDGDTGAKRDVVNYQCHKDSGCARYVIHYEYAGPGRHNPTTAEWRDADGKVLWAAYYEYEFDANRNWTHRKVYVVSPEVPQRTLYQEDTRTLTYWP